MVHHVVPQSVVSAIGGFPLFKCFHRIRNSYLQGLHFFNIGLSKEAFYHNRSAQEFYTKCIQRTEDRAALKGSVGSETRAPYKAK